MLDYKNPRLVIETGKIDQDSVKWRSPSNLAIIKYWGKYGLQLPKNPSLSFTLKNAFTETTLEYRSKTGIAKGIALSFFFNGQLNEAFGEKARKFLESLTGIFPFLRQLELCIRTTNSFPHSAGIASSASGMSALALCLCSLEEKLFNTLADDNAFRQKASFVSRLGSGSACRSIFAKAAVWGESGEVEGSSDLFAIPFEMELHELFKTYHDDILIVSKREKNVSSRIGHALMDDNIYAENRYQQARRRFHRLLIALKNGDVATFGHIAESEALTLHALMMTSTPPYILMKPNSLQIIERVRAYRESTGKPLYFSLDAGPNLHLLYPDEYNAAIREFIKNELILFCENGEWIEDGIGEGPVEL